SSWRCMRSGVSIGQVPDGAPRSVFPAALYSGPALPSVMTTLGDIARYIGARASGADLGSIGAGGISSVPHNSPPVVPGGMFVAIAGAHTDGYAFVGEATRRGASAIVSERQRPEGFQGVWMEVDDARVALARASSMIYGHPSAKLRLAGITGTNGKT